MIRLATHVPTRLPAFQDAHSDLHIESERADRNLGLIEKALDVAVPIGEMADLGLIARRAASAGRLPEAGPAYLAAHDRPKTPADLAGQA